jgi:hypothetical protein
MVKPQVKPQVEHIPSIIESLRSSIVSNLEEKEVSYGKESSEA